MTSCAWRCTGLLAMAGVVACSMAFAQPDKKQDKGTQPAGQPAGQPDAQQQAEMDAWMKAAEPGEQHKQLAQFVGEWNAKNTMWMFPGGEPMVSDASETGTMILGGRHLFQEYKGSMMGQAFDGRGTMSYDNVSKKLIGTWMDSAMTGVMWMEGTIDHGGKVFTIAGEMVEPSGKKSKMRMVTTIKDKDHHVMESFVTGEDGKEWKNMEIAYTRKGAGGTPAAKPAGK